MLKLFAFLAKRKDMDLQAFRDHYEDRVAETIGFRARALAVPFTGAL
jgi:hypothetical protein